MQEIPLNKEELKKIPNIPGIYLITNKINGKRYVGKSLHLRDRIYRHILKEDPNKILYKAFNKYGLENFVVNILYQNENISEKCLFQLETEYIEKLGTYAKEYNMTKGGEGISGHKYSKEERQKMRERYLNNSPLLQQSKGCKCITYCYNLEDKNIKIFNSRKEAAQYLVHIGYKSSDTQIVKAIKNKSNHHNCLFSNTLEDLNKLIINNEKPKKKRKIDYNEFYNTIILYADDFGILPTMDQLSIILKMPKTSISRRIKVLQDEHKIRKINILDQHRLQLSSSLYDQSFFNTGTILTNLDTREIQFIYDKPDVKLFGYTLNTIKEKRKQKLIIDRILLETGCLYNLVNVLGIDSVTGIWKKI